MSTSEPAITVRLFEPADASCVKFDVPNHGTMSGITILIDDRVAAFGGLYHVGGRCYTFFELIDDRVRRPALLHRLVKGGMEAHQSARATGVPSIISFVDARQPSAERWHKRLGFRPVEEHERDDIIAQVEAHFQMRAWIWHSSD